MKLFPDYEYEPDEEVMPTETFIVRFTLHTGYADVEDVCREIADSILWLTPDGGHRGILQAELVEERCNAAMEDCPQ